MPRIASPNLSIGAVTFAAVACLAAPTLAEHSVARIWNEACLQAIRKDFVRPPVQARNLFHLSIALWDGFAMYDPAAVNYLTTEEVAAKEIDAARRETISYAALRVLQRRYQNSPGAAQTLPMLRATMVSLGYDPDFTSATGDSPAARGNRLASLILNTWAPTDGSHEEINHASLPGTYLPVNAPLIVSIEGNPDMVFPNRYQPLALSYYVDQNGNPVPGGFPAFVCPFWGFVRPFSLVASEMSPTRPGVYLDPGPPPLYEGLGDAEFRSAMVEVIRFSSWLDPRDGVMMDISPRALGNSPLGTNDGQGRPLNPFTGKPYAPNLVPRGDFTRCLAEFWADGPNSETPPGHWNSVANYAVDALASLGQPLRWRSEGAELTPLEWDVRMYLALNGAMHDAAVAAWGIKGHYDSVRPISAIRYVAGQGQCSDPAGPSFSQRGLPLVPGLVEVITAESSAPGERHDQLAGNEGKLAVRSWLGSPENPQTQFLGVDWVLAGNWLPYQRPTFVSPPFAGYVSGHSTYSRAAAEVLTHATGTEYFPGGMGTFVCEQNQFLVFEDGPSQTLTLQWATYRDAADQSGMSRIYGGIHPRFDDLPGRVLGHAVGNRAALKAESYFPPETAPCPADLDGDGSVASSDLTLLLAAWGACGKSCAADLDDDGQVAAGDLATLLAAWGDCP
jgi:hypothetical protein